MSRRSRRIQGIAPEVSGEQQPQRQQQQQEEQGQSAAPRVVQARTRGRGRGQHLRGDETTRGQEGRRGRGRGHAGGQQRQEQQPSIQTQEPAPARSTTTTPPSSLQSSKDDETVMIALRNIANRLRQRQQRQGQESSFSSSATEQELIGVLKGITDHLQQQQQTSSSASQQKNVSSSVVVGNKRQRETNDENDYKEREREERRRYGPRMEQMALVLNQPEQLARRPFVNQYKDHMEDVLEEAVRTLYDFIQAGTGGRNRDPRLIQERITFLDNWDMRITDYQLAIMTKMVALHRYQELIWKWEDIYEDCVHLANISIDKNDIDAQRDREAQFVIHAEKLIKDDLLRLPDIVAHFEP